MATQETPVRAFMDDPKINWRTQKPNYTLVDTTYLAGKISNHAQGSLERKVEDLVKTWEMEFTHKPDYREWGSISGEDFTMEVNGRMKFSLKEITELGSYNVFLKDCPLWSSTEESFESSHTLFRSVFGEGFAWEVLEVLSGPPRVTCTWRHFTKWTGSYKDTPPSGEMVDMRGVLIVDLTPDEKIAGLEIYYDPNPFMLELMGNKLPKCPLA